MIHVTVSNAITITGLSTSIKQALKQSLTIENKEFFKMQKMGVWAARDFKYWKEPKGFLPEQGALEIPRGCLTRLLAYLKSTGAEINVVENLVDKKANLGVSTLVLRDYQVPIVDRITELRPSEGLIVLSTGAGKTLVALEILHRWGLTSVILVHNSVLAGQFVSEAERFWGIKASRIDGKHKEIGNLTVATFQSLYANSKLLEKLADNTSVVVIDECFVGDTKILTSNGYKKIKNVIIGDLVVTPLGYQKVLRTIKKRSEILLNIKIDSSKNFLVTANHPFLTEKGWVKAGELRKGDKILTIEFACDTMSKDSVYLTKKYANTKEMPALFKTVYDSIERESNKILFKKMCVEGSCQRQRAHYETKDDKKFSGKPSYALKKSEGGVYKKSSASKRTKRQNEEKQSDAQGRNSEKSFRDAQTNRNETCDKRRERYNDTITSKDFVGSARSRVGARIPCDCGVGEKNEFSDLLQNRYCLPETKDRRGSGRWFSPSFEPQNARQEKRQISYFSRVEDISIQKPRSDEEYYEGFEVYNIEVENCPMYVANGCVVHNCQGIVSKERAKVLSAFRPKHILGLTATPQREGSLTKAIFFLAGHPIAEHQMEQAQPEIEVVRTGIEIPVSDTYNDIIVSMVESKSRNTLIASLITGELLNNRKVLVLTKRIAHYKLFEEIFTGDKTFFIDSDDKDRNEVLAALKTGLVDFNIIFGTASLLAVGTDIPSLDTLILACDMKSSVLTTQSVGRILRLFEGKPTPRIIDLYDDQNPILASQFKTRLDLYKSKAWEIKHLFKCQKCKQIFTYYRKDYLPHNKQCYGKPN